MQTQDAQVAIDEATANPCPVCGGDGFLVCDDDAELQCEVCDGSGQVQPDVQAA